MAKQSQVMTERRVRGRHRIHNRLLLLLCRDAQHILGVCLTGLRHVSFVPVAYFTVVLKLTIISRAPVKSVLTFKKMAIGQMIVQKESLFGGSVGVFDGNLVKNV